MIRHAYLVWYGNSQDKSMDLLSAWSTPNTARDAWSKEMANRTWGGKWRIQAPYNSFIYRAYNPVGTFLRVEQVRLQDQP